MPNPSPLRPRGPRSADTLGLGRVRVDIVDLQAIETHMSPLGNLKIGSDQLEGEASSMDDFASLNLSRLDSITFTAGGSAQTASRMVVKIDREKAMLISTMEPTSPSEMAP